MSESDKSLNAKTGIDRIASEGRMSPEAERPTGTSGRGAEREVTIAAVVLVVVAMWVGFPAKSEFHSDQGPHMLITAAIAGGVALLISLVFSIGRRR
jgi:hypothetical protein